MTVFLLDCFHSPPTLALVMCCSGDPFPISYLWPDPLQLYYIIPFWHLLSNFNEMTQANKLSLNFPSLCPLVSSFINWTANVVLIFSFLQLNLKWPRLLVVYGLELLFLDISIHSMTSLLFFFLSCGDEWTRHTVSRHPRSWQWRHGLQVSAQFRLTFLKIKCAFLFFFSSPHSCMQWDVGGPLLLRRKGYKRNSSYKLLKNSLYIFTRYLLLGAVRAGAFL